MREVLDPEGGVAFEVYVILIDQYDNYLGPGYELVAVLAPPGRKWGDVGRRVRLNDNLDGSYSGRVSLTQAEVDAPG